MKTTLGLRVILTECLSLSMLVGMRHLECHFSPVLVRRPVSSHGHRNL